MRKVILVSTSPRRIAILKKFGFLKKAVNPRFDESSMLLRTDADILKAALGKLHSVKSMFDGEILVACDTVVKIGEKYIGKPKDRKDAERMMRSLSGRMHKVISYLAVHDRSSGRTHVKKETTKVYFRKIGDEELALYLKNEDYMDKAGAYAVQDSAALFIERIEGDYLNVVGFPLCSFHCLYKKLLDDLANK